MSNGFQRFFRYRISFETLRRINRVHIVEFRVYLSIVPQREAVIYFIKENKMKISMFKVYGESRIDLPMSRLREKVVSIGNGHEKGQECVGTFGDFHIIGIRASESFPSAFRAQYRVHFFSRVCNAKNSS